MGDFINEKVMPMIDKFTNSRIIKILMNGFMGVAALTIGGSLFAMLRSLEGTAGSHERISIRIHTVSCCRAH